MQYRVPTTWAKFLVGSRGGGDPTRHLTQPLMLEDGRTPRILSRTLYTICGFILTLILWGSVSEVREITLAPGQIVPSGQVHTVNHLEGGIVAELMVHEGDRVMEGQPIMRLEPVAVASDLEQLQVRRAGLVLQIIRLDAVDRETMPDFSGIQTTYPELAAEQQKLYASAVDQRRQERVTLEARVSQRRQDVAAGIAAVDTANAQVPLARDLFEMQAKLISQGYTPTKTYLEAKSALLRIQGEAVTAEIKLKAALAAQEEAESTLAQADTVALQKNAEERGKAAADLAETERQIAKFSDRLDRVVVRAPSAGLVQEIIPKIAGEVVKPGDVVARIVPSGYELVAEVRIDPRNSGHVQVGEPADVKFATFDSAIFGTIAGTVERISATTFPAATAPTLSPGQSAPEPYYKATVRLSSDHIGTGAMKRPISAGMVVQANIVTGSKSIVRYLLKPIFNSLDLAFTER
jgi:adhesin transport system membrane fusion protein